MGDFPSFWKWLFKRDHSGDRGIDNIVNIWLIFHFLLAISFTFIARIHTFDFATKIAVPGSAILVGLSFAWAGRSASLFQDKSFSEFIIRYGAPVEGYLYSFQLAILSVLLFLGSTFLIACGGAGITTSDPYLDSRINIFIITFLGSISLRECWGSIYFVNKLTIQYYAIRTKEID